MVPSPGSDPKNLLPIRLTASVAPGLRNVGVVKIEEEIRVLEVLAQLVLGLKVFFFC
jgi:hypothetical protein